MFKIAIMGCGVVGSGVADILIQKSEFLSEKFNEKVELAKIVDIRDFKGTAYAPYTTADSEDVFRDDDIKLVVVTIGGCTIAYDLAKKALMSGRHVVTSNKEVVAEYGCELVKLAFENNVRFLYEASAGGGIPIIRPLNICLAANDVYEIQGILNGTTNYILTKMKNDRMTFEDALAKAQKNGYAEANPSADVDGFDAVRKIAILSTIAYDEEISYKDLSCKGIRDISYEDLELAGRAGFAIKLIAGSKKTEKGIEASVEPLLLPKDNMLAGVSGVFNAVLVKGSYTGDSMFYGQGAGKMPTASAVLGDIIEILGKNTDSTLPKFVSQKAKLDKSNDNKYRYFVRFHFCDDSVDETEMIEIIKAIFGNESVYCNPSEQAIGIAAIVTGYINEQEISKKIDAFSSAVKVKTGNYIKVYS